MVVGELERLEVLGLRLGIGNGGILGVKWGELCIVSDNSNYIL